MKLTVFGSFELQQKYTTRLGEECLDFIFKNDDMTVTLTGVFNQWHADVYFNEWQVTFQASASTMNGGTGQDALTALEKKISSFMVKNVNLA